MKLFLLCFLSASMIGFGRAQTVSCSEEPSDGANPFACFAVNQFSGCSNCFVLDGLADVDFQPGSGLTCSEAEDNYCPAIRCCEPCEEAMQWYMQCILLESFSAIGFVEPGCTLDCSRFPYGVVEEEPASTPEPLPSATSPPTNSALSDSIITDPPIMDTEPPTGDFGIGFVDENDDLGYTVGESNEECFRLVDEFEKCAERKCRITSCDDEPELNFLQDDICDFAEQFFCLIEGCCKPCSDEYMKALSCDFETFGFGLNECSYSCRGRGKGSTAAGGSPAAGIVGLSAVLWLSLLGMMLNLF